LEEVLEADLLLHVRDASHPEAEGQKADVESVLESLGIGETLSERMVEVLNKIDLIEADARSALLEPAKRRHPAIAISAIPGGGVRPSHGVDRRAPRPPQNAPCVPSGPRRGPPPRRALSEGGGGQPPRRGRSLRADRAAVAGGQRALRAPLRRGRGG